MSRLPSGKMRRLIVALTLLVVGAGCGSGGGEGAATELRVLMTDDWVTPPFLDAVREFEREHPNVVVKVDKGPINLMEEEVQAGAASGRSPDVVQGHAFSAAAQGLARPLDDFWKARLKVNHFFPGAIEDVRWIDRLYGVPLDTNAMVLMYNEDHFKAAGLDPPAPQMTFAEFAELARALTTPDGSRRAIAYPTSSWWAYGWIRAGGGETLSVAEDGKPEPSLDSPQVVEALSFLADLVRQGYAFPPRFAKSSSSDALALFEAGSVSMHASGSWSLMKAQKGMDGANYGVTLMPRSSTAVTGSSAMGGSSLFVPKASTQPQLAFDFMVKLISDPFALRFAKEQGRLPVRLRVFEDPYFQDPDIKVFREQLKTAQPPKAEAFPAVADEMASALDAILREGSEPEVTLREAQARARSALGPG